MRHVNLVFYGVWGACIAAMVYAWTMYLTRGDYHVGPLDWAGLTIATIGGAVVGAAGGAWLNHTYDRWEDQ